MPGAWKRLEVNWPQYPPEAVRAFARGGPTAWLDSSATEPVSSDALRRFSLICRDPVATIEQPLDGPASISFAGGISIGDENGWNLWKRIHSRLPVLETLEMKLGPGWVGYVGFEMGGYLERLPRTNPYDLGLPLMRMMLFDRAIVLDHRRRRAFALCAPQVRTSIGLPDEPFEDFLEGWQNSADADPRTAEPEIPRFDFELPREDYRRMLRRALEYIAAGDIYQVNLAQRIRFEGIGNSFDAYCRMRRANPAAFAAYLQWADGAVGSVSPELFLRLRRRQVLTSPIKGTRPRTGDPALDAAYQRALRESEKDAAELAMIIDLHRNDLGKVCEYGSVHVRVARRIEAHPTVYHTVADVTGRLRSEYDGLDLLRACFPAGSISGVPKIRALEIIDELESAARGVYTGAIGVLGLDGQAVFNVAIRTVQFHQDTAWVYVGGGIVADSDPEEEYEETIVKALGIMNGLLGESKVESRTRCERR